MTTQPSLLHVDDHLAVLDKPAGWLAHPAGTDAPDLRTWLADQDMPGGFEPAHRLDVGTSGIVLFATSEFMPTLHAAFSAGEVDKRYTALLFGKTRAKGRITRALKDARRGKAVKAESRYRTVEQFPKWSLVEATPVTGRKHQLRRHFQGIGHSVVGDDRYPARGKPTVPAFPGRLWLHASTLTLPDGQSWTSPLPPELAAHLEVLRAR